MLQGLGLAVGSVVVVAWRCQSAQTDEGGVKVKHRLDDDEDENHEVERRCGYISAWTPLTSHHAVPSSYVRQPMIAPGSNALKRPLLCNGRSGLAMSIAAINPFISGSDTARA